jgi:hypothetical protein
MDEVELLPDGLMLEKGRPITGDPLPYCGNSTMLNPGFTLRSLFLLLRRYPDLVRLNRFFPGMLERYDSWPGQDCHPAGLDWLQLTRTVEMIGFPGKPRLEIYTAFHGVAGGEPLEIKSWQVENLLDTPVRLGGLKHIVFGDKVNVFVFETAYTLFEVLEGIGWQLAFHGTPTECSLRR